MILRKLPAGLSICVGLDIDLEMFPEEFDHLLTNDRILSFSKEIVLLTKNLATAYKINKAFIDFYADRHLLRNIIQIIREIDDTKPIFIDCKIGDIANTMKFYLKNIFDYIGADGVVINPYMGGEVFDSLKVYSDRYFLVLVKTSGSRSNIIQDLPVKKKDGKSQPLWKSVFKIVFDELPTNQTIPILSGSVDFAWVDNNLPEGIPIFYAGIGKQGGDLSDLKTKIASKNRAVLVNSSRGIIYSYNRTDRDWRKKVVSSIKELELNLNRLGEKV